MLILQTLLIIGFGEAPTSPTPPKLPRYLKILSDGKDQGLDEKTKLSTYQRKRIEQSLEILKDNRDDPATALRLSYEASLEACKDLPSLDPRLDSSDIRDCRKFTTKTRKLMGPAKNNGFAKEMLQMTIRSLERQLAGSTKREQQNAMTDDFFNSKAAEKIFEDTPARRREKTKEIAKDRELQNKRHEGKSREAFLRQMELSGMNKKQLKTLEKQIEFSDQFNAAGSPEERQRLLEQFQLNSGLPRKDLD